MALKKTERALLEVLEDPVAFAEGILGLTLWEKQKEILRAIKDNRYVAIKSCNSAGKTFLLAIAIIWWTVRSETHHAISTAANFSQVERQLWSEVRTMIANCPHKIVKELNLTEFKNGPANWAVGLATDKGVRIQGFKGDLLSCFDEAIGIRDDVWTGAMTLMSNPKAHIVVSFNPTLSSGKPYEIFMDGSGKWKTFTISAYDTPNLRGIIEAELLDMRIDDTRLDEVRFEGLISRRYVWEVLHEPGGGKDDWRYQAYVLGEFPRAGPNALIDWNHIERASERAARDMGGQLVAGIDVAASFGGDETVVVIREGPSIIDLKAFRVKDARGEVAAALALYKGRLATVNVDEPGAGVYFAPYLADLGYPVHPVNVGLPANDPAKFKNLRAEMFWGLRERFEQGLIAGITDVVLIEQLKRLRYVPTASQQIAMQSKQDIKKEDHYSPDRADACALAYLTEPGQPFFMSTLDRPADRPVTAGLLEKII